jgi:antitoxin component YwqK of YwqJK toxin-antitoxin module
MIGVCAVLGCSPPDGPFANSYSDGTKKVSGSYKDGEKSGSWIYYWTTGAKQVEGQYKKGKQAGTWKYHNKNGTVIAEGTFQNGKMWDGTFIRYIIGTKKVMRYTDGKEILR